MTPARRLLAVGAVMAAGLAVGAWALSSSRQPAHISTSAPAALASPTSMKVGDCPDSAESVIDHYSGWSLFE